MLVEQGFMGIQDRAPAHGFRERLTAFDPPREQTPEAFIRRLLSIEFFHPTIKTY